MLRRSVLAGLLLGCLASVAKADAISPEQIKQAAMKALPALLDNRDKQIQTQISGHTSTPVAFGECFSCHWSGAAVFGLSMMQRHELVDRKEVQKFDKMLKRHITADVVYIFDDKSIQLLKKAGLPDDKAVAVKKNVPGGPGTSKKLLEQLGKHVPAAVLEASQAEIIKQAARPNFYETDFNKPGDNALQSASLLIAGTAAVTSNPDQFTKALAERMLLFQDEDGSFKQRCPQTFFPVAPNEQGECQTLWGVIGLYHAERSPAVAQCLERANAYLLKTKPGKSTVTLLLRTLWAHAMKDEQRVAEFSKAFLKQQHADGGWSGWDWSKPDYDSDAWATGMALYTLSVLGRKHTDPDVQRGLAFLLKAQEADGGWTTINAKSKGARIWTYWATSWAVAGLVEMLPGNAAARPLGDK
jgi:hypothetical protein